MQSHEQPSLKSAWLIQRVAHSEASDARRCDNATVGHHNYYLPQAESSVTEREEEHCLA